MVTMTRQLELETIIRPNILLAKRALPPNFSEIRSRSKILLDANENSVGSCLGRKGQTSRDALNGSHYRDSDLATLLFSESLHLNRYPSASMAQLKQQIVSSRGLLESRIGMMTLGAGAVDLVDLLIRVTCSPGEDSILVTPPTFPLYQSRAAINDVNVFESKLRFVEDDFHLHVPEILDILAQNERIKLVFLTSPGNPTGSIIPLQQIQEILKSPVFKGLVVVDEAYIDFAPEANGISALSLMDQFPNLVVLQTLSKSYGLAGIRLGIAYAHEAITEMMQKVQIPFSISSPTAALAMMALSPAYQQSYQTAVTTVVGFRERLIDEAQGPELSAVRVGPPIGGNAANFILLPVWTAEGPAGVRDGARARRAWEVLRSEYDTAVSYVGDVEGCEGCLRITVGTMEENGNLLRDMIKVFGKV